MSISRRTLLLSLASLPPLTALAGEQLVAADASTQFLEVSRVITGSTVLTPGAVGRIEALLRGRIAGFDGKLAQLAGAIVTGQLRDDALRAPADDQLDFALAIARPWYLGYVGSPSPTVLKDNSAFATYLEAQAYGLIEDIVPRMSYPPAGAGWWQAAPEGVDPSGLAADAASWAYQPRKSYEIARPDPAWRAYAAGDYPTIEAAQAALGRRAKGAR